MNQTTDQNEIIIQDLLAKLQEYQVANQHYKEYCDDLEKRLAATATEKPQETQHQLSDPRLNVTNYIDSSIKDDYSQIQNSISIIRESYVDIDATEICSSIEKYLHEANENLNDENLKETIEKLFFNLFELVFVQYSSKEVYRLNKTRDSLVAKFDVIQKRLNKFNDLSKNFKQMLVDHDKLKADYDTIKSNVNCKSMIDNGQCELITMELDRCRKEMECVKSKVVEQNHIILSLVDKLDGYNNSLQQSRPVTTATTETDNQNDDSGQVENDRPSPGDSFTTGFYNTIQPTMTHILSSFVQLAVPDSTSDSGNSTTSSTVPVPRPRSSLREREHQPQRDSLAYYQCPKCLLQVTNEIDFEVFREHVSKCENGKHSCMFCLKVFNQDEWNSYIQHVNEEHN